MTYRLIPGFFASSRFFLAALTFALVGGVWLMWILDYNMSVAVAIGFIALAGVAAETGVVMLLYLDQAYNSRREHELMRDGRMLTLRCETVPCCASGRC